MTSEWDDYADGWDDDPAARAYAEAASGSLRSLLTSHGLALSGADVCDFGAGTGLLTERLVGECRSVDAVDTSTTMLAVLDEKIARHSWRGVRTMAEQIDSPAAYDLIVCSSVCGFLPDYAGTVADLVSSLRPGGLFVQWDWEADPSAEPADGLTRDAMLAALRGAGLESVDVAAGFQVEFGDMTMAPLMGSGRVPVA